jgi:hypothetical protein
VWYSDIVEKLCDVTVKYMMRMMMRRRRWMRRRRRRRFIVRLFIKIS